MVRWADWIGLLECGMAAARRLKKAPIIAAKVIFAHVSTAAIATKAVYDACMLGTPVLAVL
ncbi:hypothetical protein GCM10027398_32010 [Azotobacter salinestris]